MGDLRKAGLEHGDRELPAGPEDLDLAVTTQDDVWTGDEPTEEVTR